MRLLSVNVVCLTCLHCTHHFIDHEVLLIPAQDGLVNFFFLLLSKFKRGQWLGRDCRNDALLDQESSIENLIANVC
jgi:hypothetical protein